MNAQKALEIMKTSTFFWSRLGFCYDPPMLDDNGKPLVFDSNFDFYTKTHDCFADAGVKIHTCILHAGWVGVDKYDYSLCDSVLDAIFSSGKVEYFIPRIKLNVPVEWCRENPTEVCVYSDGPRDAESVRALVGTLKQDYLGYESKVGYYNANGWQDTRPNVGGVISMQSFSSKKWLHDAGVALEKLVQHIENGPYADKIIAYHIAYGVCGESNMWGQKSGKFGDYGVSNQQNFLDWALKKYGSKKALESAWGKIDGDIVPPPEARESKDYILFRDDVRDRRALDYDTFVYETNTDAISHFGAIVKRITNGKAVGAFYGYIMYMARCVYAGHIGWQRLLDCPNVDFFAAPKSYYRCAPGEPSGEMAPTVGVNRKKYWVDECDIRTHLVKGDVNSNASTLEETTTVHLREFCKNLSHGSGFWFMDLGGGWFDDEDIMKNIALLAKAGERIRKKPHESVAEILVVADENGILHSSPSLIPLAEDSLRNLQLCGAPLDVVFTHDLDEMDLSGVRLIVLLHPIAYTDELLTKLRQKLPRDASILWHGKAHSAQSESSDFCVEHIPMSVDTARGIVERAGVHCYAPKECTVYADNRVISFFPREDMTFECKLKQKSTLKNIQTGETHEAVDTLKLELKARGGVAFEIE